jgi:hypothetical protein
MSAKVLIPQTGPYSVRDAAPGLVADVCRVTYLSIHLAGQRLLHDLLAVVDSGLVPTQ